MRYGNWPNRKKWRRPISNRKWPVPLRRLMPIFIS